MYMRTCTCVRVSVCLYHVHVKMLIIRPCLMSAKAKFCAHFKYASFETLRQTMTKLSGKGKLQ